MTTMQRTNRRGRHVLEGGRRRLSLRGIRFGLRVTPGRMATTAAAILIGVFGAAAAAAGSYAYLNATVPVGTASSITAGTSTLTLQSGASAAGSSISLPSTVWNRMLPGDIAGQTITVANTGDTPLSISTRLSSSIAWNIRIATGSCPATQLPGAAQTTTATTWTTIAAGSSATMCIQAVLPTTAAASVQGTAPVVQLLVDGVQVP